MGEAAFTPTQSAVLATGDIHEENETGLLKDIVHKLHDPLAHRHMHTEAASLGDDKLRSSTVDEDRSLALDLGDTTSMLAEGSYLDNKGRMIHAHDDLEPQKHQFTVPYTSASPAEISALPDGSPSHEQVLAA